jgi:hypothetical protein
MRRLQTSTATPTADGKEVSMLALTWRRALTALGAIVASSALGSCYFETDDGWWHWTWTNDPELVDASAGCYLDHGVPTWYFEAEVYDYDGASDIWSVEADVYDDWYGTWEASVDLSPTTHRWWWSFDIPAVSLGVDCDYPYYRVEFTVTDTWDGWDSLTIVPDTW